MDKFLFNAYRYALVICRNGDGKYLTVKQNNNKGWWIPGGKVENNQLFIDAAIRECKEEGGIDINIKGIIRVDYGKYYIQNSWRCVFYGQPINQHQEPKSQPDHESNQAKWMNLQEIEKIKNEWRSPEIHEFPAYLERGGEIYPLSIFKQKFNN